MYDLIIIGGGMSGISVAHFFRDQNILLLEKGDLLSGATGNNAGYLITGFGEHFFRTVRRWGIERALEIQRIHISAHRKIRELSNHVHECGSYTVPTTQKETDELRRSYELMRQHGFHVDWREEDRLGLREKQPALFNAQDGLIDSKAFWKQLAEPLPCRTNIEVLNVIEEANQLRILTTAEDLYTRRVIYCLNAYSGNLIPELEGRIIPLRGQMVEVEIFDPAPCELPVIAEYGEIYWNFTASTLRLGGLEYMISEDEVGIARSVSPRVLAAQFQWMRQNIDTRFSENPLATWCGTMGFTVDGFPIIGALPGRRNEFVLAGMCGLGHSYALECASWLYDLITNQKNRIPSYFASDRILNLPRYSGGDWRSLYEAWHH